MALVRTRTGLILAMIIAGGLGLSACGVKGPLEPPPDAKVAGDSKSADSADSGKNSEGPKKPHESFFLDSLLR
jgi:predicted small lipoprotein YifL